MSQLEEKKVSSSHFSLLTPGHFSDSLHHQQCPVPIPATPVFLSASASQIHLGTDTCAAFQSIEAGVDLSILVLTVVCTLITLHLIKYVLLNKTSVFIISSGLLVHF